MKPVGELRNLSTRYQLAGQSEDGMALRVWQNARQMVGAMCSPAGCVGLAGPTCELIVIASWGGGWDHVSARAVDRHGGSRTPTWDEMCFIKDLFWNPDECVMQLHPPKANYKNVHPNVLHLWRPQTLVIPQPPRIMV